MTIPGKLSIDKTTGKLHGPAGTVISYNDPFPLAFSRAGVTGQMDGVVLHTMAGTLESAIHLFNGPDPKGSAHIGISQAGRIHQFVPIGRGYETFHAFAANLRRYGIETEDDGRPQTPISDAGLWAWAQCFEFLSRFAGFPLQVRQLSRPRPGLPPHVPGVEPVTAFVPWRIVHGHGAGEPACRDREARQADPRGAAAVTHTRPYRVCGAW